MNDDQENPLETPLAPPAQVQKRPTAKHKGIARTREQIAASMAKAREARAVKLQQRKQQAEVLKDIKRAAPVPATIQQNRNGQQPPAVSPPGDKPKPYATRTRHQLRPLEEYPADEMQNEKFHIPRDQWPSGYALQWEAITVYNQPQNDRQAMATQHGWEPVFPEDFDGRYAYKVPYGWEGPIHLDGLMLMARSMEWHKHAQARDELLAKNVINLRVRQMNRGELEKVTLDTQHKHLSQTNFVNASIDQVGMSGDTPTPTKAS
jgi:hypothetical protein